MSLPITDNTRLLESLLGFLPPCFNIDPVKELAFKVHSNGLFSIEVRDRHLRIWTSSEIRPAHEIALTGKTIGQVKAEIDALASFTVSDSAGDSSSAFRLLHGKEDGGAVYMFTSATWALFQAFALELGQALEAVKEALRQLSIPGATGLLQNYWGTYFDIDRLPNEDDATYGQRLMAMIQLPRSNNIAMSLILKAVLGYDTRIIDLGDTVGGEMLMNDLDTPMHDLGWCLWRPNIQPMEPCTFGVILNEDRVFGTLRYEDLLVLRDWIFAIKQSGTRPKLIWRGLGPVMLMNNIDTPVHDPAWTMANCTHQIFNGWSSTYLDNL